VAQVMMDDSLIRQISSCSRSLSNSLQGSGFFFAGKAVENFGGIGMGDVGE
jgi:hypothetical protein